MEKAKFQKNLGKHLATLRREKGLSQIEFGYLIEIEKQNINFVSFVLLFKLVRLSPIYKNKIIFYEFEKKTITYDYYFHSKLSLVVLVLDLHMNLLSFELLLKKSKLKFILIISFSLRIASTFAFGIT